jgi:hypothetical protein
MELKNTPQSMQAAVNAIYREGILELLSHGPAGKFDIIWLVGGVQHTEVLLDSPSAFYPALASLLHDGSIVRWDNDVDDAIMYGLAADVDPELVTLVPYEHLEGIVADDPTTYRIAPPASWTIHFKDQPDRG